MPTILDHPLSALFETPLRWWLSPLSGASSHQLDAAVMWHARLMVLAWAVLLPLGAVAARYFKVTPQQDWPRHLDNRTWWHAHRGLQYLGVVVMLVGTVLIFNGRDSAAATTSAVAVWHSYLGWAVVALGVVQILSAWLRGSKGGPTDVQLRGDHYDMTRHRLWFEALHKSGGWLAVILAIVTVVLGLMAADAPRWMPLVLGVWWAGLIAASVYLERGGRCIDTYQAIWGPHLKHPGNQRKINGWGMRRPLDQLGKDRNSP
jgi:Eukaryotic cytochrome b561